MRRNLDEFEDMKAVIARGWKQIPIVRWAFRKDHINVFASILAYQMNDRTRNDMSCNETCRPGVAEKKRGGQFGIADSKQC